MNTLTNICIDCTRNIENNNYIINERNENTTVKSQCNSSVKVTFIDSSGKHISLNESTDLPLISNLCTNESYKDALLASLYSQVEFLRNELNEKHLLIRSLIIRESENDINNSNSNKCSDRYKTIDVYHDDVSSCNTPLSSDGHDDVSSVIPHFPLMVTTTYIL